MVFSSAMIHYAKLKEAMRIGEWSYEENIQFAKEIDDELLEVYTSMTPDLRSQAINNSAPSSDDVGDHLNNNAYKSWNSILIVRMLLNEVVLECCHRLYRSGNHKFALTTKRIETSATTLLSLSSDIRSCVLQYTYTGIPKAVQSSAQTIAPQDRAVFAHTLIPPLYIAASSSVCSSYMRAWIIGKLEDMGSVMAIPQAMVAKEMIERR
jgi:hypothetical protein